MSQQVTIDIALSPAFVFFWIKAEAPMKQSFAIEMLFITVLFTPKKQFSPISQNPDITQCDAMKQLS